MRRFSEDGLLISDIGERVHYREGAAGLDLLRTGIVVRLALALVLPVALVALPRDAIPWLMAASPLGGAIAAAMMLLGVVKYRRLTPAAAPAGASFGALVAVVAIVAVDLVTAGLTAKLIGDVKAASPWGGLIAYGRAKEALELMRWAAGIGQAAGAAFGIFMALSLVSTASFVEERGAARMALLIAALTPGLGGVALFVLLAQGQKLYTPFLKAALPYATIGSVLLGLTLLVMWFMVFASVRTGLLAKIDPNDESD